ncbi:hypothetical protein BYT27DRAFT_7206295, partial [Phlegmacium glaucopus]
YRYLPWDKVVQNWFSDFWPIQNQNQNQMAGGEPEPEQNQNCSSVQLVLVLWTVQIDPKSYLGTALQYIRQSQSRKQHEPASSPSNSSDNASSDEERLSDKGSELSDQLSQSTPHQRRRDCRHGCKVFNYCSPIDYRMQMQKALNCCHQNEKSVAEYTYELQELLNMIGAVSEQDRVIKFWNGSQPIIQKELWRDNLNPEISTWDEVIAQAEIIEILENIAER